ncbi:MAG: hypothetical protein IK066_11745 [Kiritimatiellae bacterium]|nr:hypothetical protein [Kiritimatiellia bacterium]
MIAAVQDANVLIDLLNAGLFEASAGLGMAFHVVDVVVAEIEAEEQRRELSAAVSNGWLVVDGLDESGLERAAAFQNEAPPISFEDAASLSLAQRLGAILLTGNRQLRILAQRHSTETHGVLWLLDSLLDAAIVDEPTAANALRTMMSRDARLPADECNRRLAMWQ